MLRYTIFSSGYVHQRGTFHPLFAYLYGSKYMGGIIHAEHPRRPCCRFLINLGCNFDARQLHFFATFTSIVLNRQRIHSFQVHLSIHVMQETIL
jgi:hypothetical protein